jgi:hypothetical protein
MLREVRKTNNIQVEILEHPQWLSRFTFLAKIANEKLKK